MAEIEVKDGIFTIYIPTAFTFDSVSGIFSALEVVEQHPGPTALIFVSKSPKIFNAGMDLKFLLRHDRKTAGNLFTYLMRLYRKIMFLGVPTIAAINGHVIAAGLMFALACDYRVMNKDLGSAKLPEISLGAPLPRGANSILSSKLAPDVHRDLLFSEKAFNAQECLDKKIVDFIVPKDQLLAKAIEIAKEYMKFGEKKDIYSLLKVSTYNDIAISEPKYSEEEVKGLIGPKL